MNRQTHGRLAAAFVAMALLFGFLSPASATVIYEEAIEGDLPNDRLLAKLITLPPIPDGSFVRIWSIFGAVGGLTDPADTWEIEVPFGHRIRDIKIGADLVEGAEPLRFRLFSIVDRSTLSGYRVSPPITLLDTITLLGADVDEGVPFTPSSFGEGRHGMEFKSADDPPYVVHIELELVPEPGTLGLIGLSGIALLRRRG